MDCASPAQELSRAASAAVRVCFHSSPEASYFPGGFGFHQLRDCGCAGEGPRED